MAIGSNGGTPSEFFYSELYNQYEGGADEIAALASGGNFNTDNAVKVADTLLDMIDNKLFPEVQWQTVAGLQAFSFIQMEKQL